MKDKILEMAAGVLLDSLVAEDVMGWKERVDFDVVNGMIARYIPNTNDVEQFSPSIDISAAWEVLDQFKTHQITRSDSGFSHSPLRYRVIVGKNMNVAYSNSAPEAICKAALLAVMDA